MEYNNREDAIAKALELSAFSHSTFTVYKNHGASYLVINGVDDNRKSSAIAQFLNGRQRF